jgi:hypothetical protein
MVAVVDNEDMFAIAFIIGLVAICVLGAIYGTDSRHDGASRNHPNI